MIKSASKLLKDFLTKQYLKGTILGQIFYIILCFYQVIIIFIRNRIEDLGLLLEFLASQYSNRSLNKNTVIEILLMFSKNLRNCPTPTNLHKKTHLDWLRIFLYFYSLMLYVLYCVDSGYYDMSSFLYKFARITDYDVIPFVSAIVVVTVFGVIALLLHISYVDTLNVYHKITRWLFRIKCNSMPLYYSIMLVGLYIITKLILFVFILLCQS